MTPLEALSPRPPGGRRSLCVSVCVCVCFSSWFGSLCLLCSWYVFDAEVSGLIAFVVVCISLCVCVCACVFLALRRPGSAIRCCSRGALSMLRRWVLLRALRLALVEHGHLTLHGAAIHINQLKPVRGVELCWKPADRRSGHRSAKSIPTCQIYTTLRKMVINLQIYQIVGWGGAGGGLETNRAVDPPKPL